MGNIERSDYERMRDKADRIERALGDDDAKDASYEAGFEAGYAKRAELDAGAVAAGHALAALLERPDANWPARDALAAWYEAVGRPATGGQ